MTWETRELPVLRAIVDLSDVGHLGGITPAHIVERTGMDPTTVSRALRALANENPSLFQWDDIAETGDIVVVVNPTGDARRAVGTWPAPDAWADRLIAALTDAADRASNPDEKTKLRRAADALGSIGKEVLTDVLTKYAERTTGLS
jgi:hypothetical protein